MALKQLIPPALFQRVAGGGVRPVVSRPLICQGGGTKPIIGSGMYQFKGSSGSSDTSLSVFTINGVNVVDGQTVNEPFGTTSVTLVATPTDPAAVVSNITGTTGLSTGDNALSFKVTAADGVTFQIYTLNIHVLAVQAFSNNGSDGGTLRWTNENGMGPYTVRAYNDAALTSLQDSASGIAVTTPSIASILTLAPGLYWFTVTVVSGGDSLVWTTGALPLIVGSALWLQGSNITGINDGDPVPSWPDKSGNGNDATQGTVSSQPEYVASDPAFSNQPTVLFDGVDDAMALSSPIGVGDPSTFTVFVVQRQPIANSIFYGICNSTSGRPFAAVYFSDGNIYVGGANGYAGASDSSTVANVWMSKSVAETFSLLKNGTPLSLSSASLAGGTQFNSIGSATGFPGSGNTAVCIVFLSDIGSTMETRIQLWLKGIYGTP